MSPPVLISVDGAVGRLSLNRPAAIHALDFDMCRMMNEALLAWRVDPAVTAVLIDHAEGRGFCAGGDIRMLAESGAADGKAARAFFHEEYRLNHLIFDYPKPVITVMDGVTMGGGVGISWGAAYRIATERTTLAMPESGIGLFPDVGGGWFLPRLHGAIGAWMCLTGARLKAAGCEILGIATDVIASERLDEFKRRFIAAPNSIETLLAEMQSDPGRSAMIEHHDEIDRLFSAPTLEGIFAALRADGGEWAKAQLAILETKSPLSCKVSLRQIQAGARMTSFADNMAMEYRVGGRMVATHDFIEGVRAVIVDKDNKPGWDPATPEGVTDEMLDIIFAPLPPGDEWTPFAA